MNCRYCPREFEDAELTVLSLSMPNYTGAHLTIHNNLCPVCTKKVLEALGRTEIEIREEASHGISNPA